MNCPSCNAVHLATAGICPSCQRPLHPPASELGKVEIRYQQLRRQWDQGTIEAQEFYASVQQLQLKDANGGRWWLDGQGTWHRWDGAAWRQTEAALFEHKQKKRLQPWLMALGCGGAAVLIAALGIFLYAGWDEYQSSPMMVEAVEFTDIDTATEALSSEQQRVLAEFGNPQAFSLMFYEQPGGSGPAPVRAETWTYYQQGLEFVFINGALAEEIDSEIEASNLAPLNYMPTQFIAYMTLNEVIAAAGVDSYLAVPLDPRYMRAGAVYYADGLTFGLQDGELRYLEAMAVEEEVGS